MGKDISSITDEVDAMRQAIEHPIGGNTLSQIVTPEKNIVIIVSDATRDAHTPEILQALTGELNALGVRDDRITILIALGTHRRQTEEEDVIVCGKDMVKRFPSSSTIVTMMRTLSMSVPHPMGIASD